MSRGLEIPEMKINVKNFLNGCQALQCCFCVFTEGRVDQDKSENDNTWSFNKISSFLTATHVRIISVGKHVCRSMVKKKNVKKSSS